ncbi:MAG: hypothetical protein WBD75_09350 [Phycisphaerae bacterium]
MTAPDSPRPEPEPLVPAGRPFSAMRALAWVVFGVAVAGLAFHVVFYLAGPTEWLAAYARGLWMKIGIGVAFANLLAGHLHYWRTRMRLDVASRVLAYLWILSIIPYLRLMIRGALAGQ